MQKDSPAQKEKKRGLLPALISILAALAIFAAVFCLRYFSLLPERYYSAEDFGIKAVASGNDANGNGIGDFTDILLGARQDAQNRPRYDGAYWPGGYPPEDIGVCSDVVWRALQNAGYSLKDLIDADIAANPDEYPGLDATGPDPNIDFRRVRNLQVFFGRKAQTLTTDLEQIGQWQPGDIVVFGEKYTHIGIISDRRNKNGIPWLIHNSGQPRREENVLERLAASSGIYGHYRWMG